MYDLRHFTVRLYQWQYIEDTKTMLVHSVLCCIKTICKRNRFNIICKDNIGMILVIIIYTEKIFKNVANRNSNCFLRGFFYVNVMKYFINE